MFVKGYKDKNDSKPFARLQALGEERFTKIVNLLIRGESGKTVAREIQAQPPEGWGEFQDVQEATLAQQLIRLRIAAAEGMFGFRQAKAMQEGHGAPVRMLQRVSVQVLDRLEELSDWQRERVMALMKREREGHLLPEANIKMAPQEYRHLLTQTNLVFNDYKELLKDIQKVRFDMGIDIFRGPVQGAGGILRGASSSVTLPDGTNVQRQVFEAVTELEQIFEARAVPRPDSVK